MRERIDIRRRAVRPLVQDPGAQRHFELMDDGGLVPWEEGPQNTWIAKAPRQPNATDDIADK